MKSIINNLNKKTMNPLKFTFAILLTSLFFSCSKINSVSIDSAPESVFKGSSVQLKAVVKAEGSPDTTLNWVIVEPVVKGTTITKDGLITVSGAEIAKSITIKAISVGDTSKSAVSNIKLVLNPELFYGTWLSKVDGFNRTGVLTKDEWNQYYSTGSFYSIIKLNWIPIINEDLGTKNEFPEGYLCAGTINKVNNIEDTRSGETMQSKFFINKEKTQILRLINNDLVGVIWTKK
jgi:hypothetical protein